VIIPTFRAGRYIEEAARSVLHQTLEDLELIVVDDGCPEMSSSRVANLPDPRIIVHRQDNRGATRARNAGLGLARGSAVLFLDADDRLRPDALRRLVAALDAHPLAAVAYGRAARMNADGHVVGLWHRSLTSREPSGEVLRVLLAYNFIRCPGAALIRSSCFQRTHGLDPAAFPGADWELWCRLASLGPFVNVRGAPVVDYRAHPASMTLRLADNPAAAMRAIAIVFNNPTLVGEISRTRLSRLYRKREASVHAWLATECMRAGDMARARDLFRTSLTRFPWNPRALILLLFALTRTRPFWF
jgi:glycosyltransferase involved in cell wall biosynthesis